MTTIAELGALLRNERELRGLSHEEISRKIKVAIRTLVALENGELAELPHPVYTKGFVKSYSRLVGLDPEEMGEVITRIYAEELLEQDDPEPVFTSRRIQPPKPRWPWVVLVLGVVCLIIGGSWYFYFRTSSSPAIVSSMSQPLSGSVVDAAVTDNASDASADKSADGQSDKTSDKALDKKADESDGTPASVSDSGALQQESPVANMMASGVVSSPDQPEPTADAAPVAEVVADNKAVKAAAKPVVAEVPPVKAKPAESQVKQQNQAVAQTEADREQVQKHSDFSAASVQSIPLAKVSGQQKLTLTATDECWVEAWGDKFERKELYLRSGQKFVLRFSKDLTLRLGNSGGVTLSLNDKVVSIAGEEGKVMTLNFTPSR